MNLNNLFASSKVTGLWVFISAIILTILAGLFMVIGAVLGVFFFSMKGAIVPSSGLLLIAALVLMTLIIILLLILMWRCFSPRNEKRSNYQTILQSIIPLLTPQNFKDIYCALKTVSEGLRLASQKLGNVYNAAANLENVTDTTSLTEAFDCLQHRFDNFSTRFQNSLPRSATIPAFTIFDDNNIPLTPWDAIKNIYRDLSGKPAYLNAGTEVTNLIADVSDIKDKFIESKTHMHELAEKFEAAYKGSEKIVEILKPFLDPLNIQCEPIQLADGTIFHI